MKEIPTHLSSRESRCGRGSSTLVPWISVTDTLRANNRKKKQHKLALYMVLNNAWRALKLGTQKDDSFTHSWNWGYNVYIESMGKELSTLQILTMANTILKNGAGQGWAYNPIHYRILIGFSQKGGVVIFFFIFIASRPTWDRLHVRDR